MTFNDMPLIAPLLKATREAGYEEPTPIQRETIPLVLNGRDVLGCAQTGTGKTAAFALPILQRLFTEKLDGSRKPRALVLTPTRELAIQIQENFALYGKHLPLRSTVVFGGVSQVPQVEALKRGVQVLIATPGRLNDLIGQGYIHLDQIEIFVLDEADRMLDMGFIHDVKRVIAQLPKPRQTLFFSATMPDEVEKLAVSILNDPETVK
jgi:ATP-dependent RNA helicase RhlE